jgi:hypothetical protein
VGYILYKCDRVPKQDATEVQVYAGNAPNIPRPRHYNMTDMLPALSTFTLATFGINAE